MNPSRIHALLTQIGVRLVGVREQQIGKSVRHHAVDLFGHGRVAGTESGLDVGLRDATLGGHQRSGEC